MVTAPVIDARGLRIAGRQPDPLNLGAQPSRKRAGDECDSNEDRQRQDFAWPRHGKGEDGVDEEEVVGEK